MVSDYKKTPIGLFPNNWAVKKNGELFDNKSIKNFPNEPVLSVTQDKGVLPRNLLEKRITMENSNPATFKLVDKGDFVISLRSFQGGLEVSEYRGIVSPAYTVIQSKLPIVTGFFKYYFKSNKFINILDKAVIGIRDGKQISFSVFSELYTPYPPLQEQSKIAEILSVVDKAIKKTKDIVKQTEQVKKGLMQQLLIKGIGHTKFKKTKMGEIPEEWEVVTLGNVAKVQGGYAFKSSDAKQEGIRWLKIANVGIGDIKWEDTSFLPKEYEEDYNEYTLKENDIVMAMTRPILNNKLKIAVTKPSDMPALLNQRVCRFHLTSIIDREFFYQLARHSSFVKEIQLKIMGTDPPNVSSKQMEEIQIPLPPIAEQIRIADILKGIDKKINKEVQRIEYLQEIKQGFMQSLLTGKVRVKVDEVEVTQV